MRMHSKLILAALAATMLLAFGVSTATAGRLQVNERNFEAIWDNALTGKRNLEFTAGPAPTVRCRVTLLGSFVERTIKKETLIKQNIINHATIRGEACENGTATIRMESLPWESRYRSFTGTLPRIRSVTIGLIGAHFRIREANGLECESATEPNHPGVGVIGASNEVAETELERTGEAEDITAERSNKIPLGGGFACSLAGEGIFSGVGLVRNLPGTRRIQVTLI